MCFSLLDWQIPNLQLLFSLLFDIDGVTSNIIILKLLLPGATKNPARGNDHLHCDEVTKHLGFTNHVYV